MKKWLAGGRDDVDEPSWLIDEELKTDGEERRGRVGGSEAVYMILLLQATSLLTRTFLPSLLGSLMA